MVGALGVSLRLLTMLAALLGAVSLSFTLPAAQAAWASCEPGAVSPEPEIALVSLYGRPDGSPESFRRLLLVADPGTPGQPCRLTAALTGAWQLCMTATDAAGNESCPGNTLYVAAAGPLAAPSPAAAPARSPPLYDVAGRKLSGEPRRSGVYFRRDRRLVIVR